MKTFFLILLQLVLLLDWIECFSQNSLVACAPSNDTEPLNTDRSITELLHLRIPTNILLSARQQLAAKKADFLVDQVKLGEDASLSDLFASNYLSICDQGDTAHHCILSTPKIFPNETNVQFASNGLDGNNSAVVPFSITKECTCDSSIPHCICAVSFENFVPKTAILSSLSLSTRVRKTDFASPRKFIEWTRVNNINYIQESCIINEENKCEDFFPCLSSLDVLSLAMEGGSLTNNFTVEMRASEDVGKFDNRDNCYGGEKKRFSAMITLSGEYLTEGVLEITPSGGIYCSEDQATLQISHFRRVHIQEGAILSAANIIIDVPELIVDGKIQSRTLTLIGGSISVGASGVMMTSDRLDYLNSKLFIDSSPFRHGQFLSEVPSCTLTCEPCSCIDVNGKVEFPTIDIVGKSFNVLEKGLVTAEALGFPANSGPGAGGRGGGGGGGGGGHAGFGADGCGSVAVQNNASSSSTYALGGSAYGDAFYPFEFGSGGGDGQTVGGRGGGRIRIVVSHGVRIDGTISADGEHLACVISHFGWDLTGYSSGGGGAGGSVFISAAVIDGGGTISAKGGDAAYECDFTCVNAGGGGSGGRISLFFERTLQSNGVQLLAKGGGEGGMCTRGAAGTIYQDLPRALIVDNKPILPYGKQLSAMTPFPSCATLAYPTAHGFPAAFSYKNNNNNNNNGTTTTSSSSSQLPVVGFTMRIVQVQGKAVLMFPPADNAFHIERLVISSQGMVVASTMLAASGRSASLSPLAGLNATAAADLDGHFNGSLSRLCSTAAGPQNSTSVPSSLTLSSTTLIVTDIVMEGGYLGCFRCGEATKGGNSLPGCADTCPSTLSINVTNSLVLTLWSKISGVMLNISATSIQVDRTSMFETSDVAALSQVYAYASSEFIFNGLARFSTIIFECPLTLVISNSATVSAAGLGYHAGLGPGAGSSSLSFGGAGGGHGGYGASACASINNGGGGGGGNNSNNNSISSMVGGSAYGGSKYPWTFGSGGGNRGKLVPPFNSSYFNSNDTDASTSNRNRPFHLGEERVLAVVRRTSIVDGNPETVVAAEFSGSNLCVSRGSECRTCCHSWDDRDSTLAQYCCALPDCDCLQATITEEGVQPNFAPGGRGGGRVKLISSGPVVIDGRITVDGESTACGQIFQSSSPSLSADGISSGGGGAGGSIWIVGSMMDGSGTISARGGSSYLSGCSKADSGGGGAGGRVAFETDQRPPEGMTLMINGGKSDGCTSGASGVLYDHFDQTMKVDNGPFADTTAALTPYPADVSARVLTVRRFAAVTFPSRSLQSVIVEENGALLIDPFPTNTATFTPPLLNVTVLLIVQSGGFIGCLSCPQSLMLRNGLAGCSSTCRPFSVVVSGGFLLSNNSKIMGTVISLTSNIMEIGQGASIVTSDPSMLDSTISLVVNGTASIGGQVRASIIRVFASTLTIEKSGALDASSLGYKGGSGPGAGGSSGSNKSTLSSGIFPSHPQSSGRFWNMASENEGTNEFLGDMQVDAGAGGGGGGHLGRGAMGCGVFVDVCGLGGQAYGPSNFTSSSSTTVSVVDFGSGGGASSAEREAQLGGRGGGAIHISSPNEITVDGLVSVDGESRHCIPTLRRGAGGGAGGTIRVAAPSLFGTGSFSAVGGSSICDVGPSGGGGGGGGIFLALSSVAPTSLNLRAEGGESSSFGVDCITDGGAGTIFQLFSSTIVIDAQRASKTGGGESSSFSFEAAAPTPFPTGAIVSSIIVRGGGVLLFQDSSSSSSSYADSMTVQSGGMIMGTAMNNNTVLRTGSLLVSSGGIVGCATCVESIRARNGISGCNDTCPSLLRIVTSREMSVLAGGTVSAISISLEIGTDFFAEQGSVITFTDRIYNSSLFLSASGNVVLRGLVSCSQVSIMAGNELDLSSDATVDASSLGYFAAMGPGAGKSSILGGSGGGHGGKGRKPCAVIDSGKSPVDGGAASAHNGDTYDDWEMGSGGGFGDTTDSPYSNVKEVEDPSSLILDPEARFRSLSLQQSDAFYAFGPSIDLEWLRSRTFACPNCGVGGRGGGRVKLVAGAVLSVSGLITADGESTSCAREWANPGGGGAGGSVWLEAPRIIGNGTISAKGGNSITDCIGSLPGGGGGGGRITAVCAVIANSLSLLVEGGSSNCPDCARGRVCDDIREDLCEFKVIQDEIAGQNLSNPFWIWKNPPSTWDVGLTKWDWMTIRPEIGEMWTNDSAHLLYVEFNGEDAVDVETRMSISNLDSSCIVAGLFVKGVDENDWITLGLLDTLTQATVQWQTKGNQVHDVPGVREDAGVTMSLRIVGDTNGVFRGFFRADDDPETTWIELPKAVHRRFQRLHVGLYFAQCETLGPTATVSVDYVHDNVCRNILHGVGSFGESGVIVEKQISELLRFVSGANGNDATGNGTASSPQKTLQAAASAAAQIANRPAQVVVVDGSVFKESNIVTGPATSSLILTALQPLDFAAFWNSTSTAHFFPVETNVSSSNGVTPSNASSPSSCNVSSSNISMVNTTTSSNTSGCVPPPPLPPPPYDYVDEIAGKYQYVSVSSFFRQIREEQMAARGYRSSQVMSSELISRPFSSTSMMASTYVVDSALRNASNERTIISSSSPSSSAYTVIDCGGQRLFAENSSTSLYLIDIRISISNCVFSGNNNNARALSMTRAVVQLTNCRFENLTFGAIETLSTLLDIRNCSFVNNRAELAPGIRAGLAEFRIVGARRSASDPARFSEASGATYVANSVFSGNSASDSGGAILLGRESLYAMNCVFVSNFAKDAGGAFEIRASGAATIVGCLFANNSASRAGGAISAKGGVVSFVDSTITTNSAAVKGGGLYIAPESGPSQLSSNLGSSPIVSAYTAMTLLRCAIVYNTVQGLTTSPGGGGAISFDRGGAATLIQCNLRNNSALNLRSVGGCIDIDTGGSILLRESVIFGHSAAYGGVLRSYSTAVGPTVAVVFDNCTLAQNKALHRGSVVSAFSADPARISGFSFAGGKVYSEYNPQSFYGNPLLRFGYRFNPVEDPYWATLKPSQLNDPAINSKEDPHYSRTLPNDPPLTNQWPFLRGDARTISYQKAASGGNALTANRTLIAFKDSNFIGNNPSSEAICWFHAVLNTQQCFSDEEIL